jgi:hypothetical protein
MPINFTYSCTLAATAALQEEALQGPQHKADIWTDHPVLQYLKSGELPAQLDGKQRGRVQRRAQGYYMRGKQLVRRMPDGAEKIVPTPEQRARLISEQHELCGHYGVRRTAAMLLTKYWWYGLLADVAHVVGRCEHCSRVHASFTAKPEQLQSIPISSMGFRWHVDTAGPFPTSRRGNTYVMVAIEAFSKYLVAVPIKDKEAETIAYAFLHNVLAHFAAPGQVVSDSGGEFEGAFAQLLETSMIDHARISADHPQANGQAEKAVHIVKRALMKKVSSRQDVKEWDQDVAWLALGYRCSPHSSTGRSPYELMYARPPVVPPAVQEVCVKPLDLDNPADAERDLLLRRERLQQACPMALENLAIAQHRDQMRYLKVRAPDYKPRVHRFAVGDFVYVQQLQRNSRLQPRAKPLILRVKEVRESGVLLLQGRCGRTTTMHMSHCAPCHLPDIDGSIDPLLLEEVEDIMCEVCGTDENEAELLLCDHCNHGWHTYCLTPPLSNIPEEHWICHNCTSQGVTAHDVALREQERNRQQERENRPNLFPNAQMKRRDAAAKELDQRLVQRTFKDPSTGRPRKYWGKLHFTGEEKRPYYFKVVYEDGEVHETTVTGVKRYLTPVGTQLPAGITIQAPPVAAAGLQVLPRIQGQQAISSRHAHDAVVPALQVPSADLAVLQRTVKMSLAQAICDPITRSTQWQQLVLQRRIPVSTGAVQQGATVIITAPAVQHIKQAVFQALQQKPALVLCYAGSLAFPACLYNLFAALQRQHRALAFRGVGGWWIMLVQLGMTVEQWLG